MQGFSKKTKGNIQYQNLPSTIRPVSHSHEIPIPIPSDRFVNCNTSDTVSSFDKLDDLKKLKLTLQSDLDDLVRDLNLTKGSSQLLGSRLKEMKFLAWYRHRELEFVKYFSKMDSLVFCNDVPRLSHQMGKKYNPADYRFFIDSS